MNHTRGVLFLPVQLDGCAMAKSASRVHVGQLNAQISNSGARSLFAVTAQVLDDFEDVPKDVGNRE